MADFKIAQALVSQIEQGYQNDSRDQGNYIHGKLIGTKYGISAQTLSAWIGHDASESEMRNLSYDTALQIYKQNYWDPIAGDSIQNQSIANLIYDGAVNQGLGGIKSIVTDSLNISGGSSWNDIANVINNYSDQNALFDLIKQNRLNKYNPSSFAFSSWTKRLSNLTFADVKEFTIKNWVPITIIGAGVGILTFLFLSIETNKKLTKKLIAQ